MRGKGRNDSELVWVEVESGPRGRVGYIHG